MQVTVMTWTPAVWLKLTLALRPLATQRSYSAENSAADIAAGCDPEQARTLSHASPLITLAHVGELGKIEGREEVCVS